MSRRKQRSAFDPLSKFDRGRIVVYRDCALSFRKIGSRVGRNQTTVMRIWDHWMRRVRRTVVVDCIHVSAPLHITPPAATPDQLWQRVESSWSAVPQKHIQSLFESMPRRVAAVISINGGYSGY
ncbi:hypothetical protein TNCV_3227451 [Trichonephila clavipes]|nr:hypothetical protein TNCV_3227451 [Trichonephila clavipes]